jgi:hypothetical protein
MEKDPNHNTSDFTRGPRMGLLQVEAMMLRERMRINAGSSWSNLACHPAVTYPCDAQANVCVGGHR